MTRSICHTSMPSLPCYVCEFGVPTGVHLMTVSTVSRHPAAGPMQRTRYTDKKTDVQHGVPRADACRHCSSVFDLRDVRVQDVGPRVHTGRALLRLPALRHRGCRCQHDPGEPRARDNLTGGRACPRGSGRQRCFRPSCWPGPTRKHPVAPAVYLADVPDCGSDSQHCTGRTGRSPCRVNAGCVIADGRLLSLRKLTWSILDGGPIGFLGASMNCLFHSRPIIVLLI